MGSVCGTRGRATSLTSSSAHLLDIEPVTHRDRVVVKELNYDKLAPPSPSPTTKERSSTVAPTYVNREDLALETFFHRSGREYTCICQGGQRFYMDSWKTQEWVPFPASWHDQGVFVTDSILYSEDDDAPSRPVRSSSRDDREGFVIHPEKGKLQTYMFEENRNGHYYFDTESGNWMPLPIAWELHSPMVHRLLEQIGDAMPNWRDRYDMLASLRASNYDTLDCIATHLSVADTDGDTPLTAARDKKYSRLIEQNDHKIDQLQTMLKRMTIDLERTKKELNTARANKDAANEKNQQLEEQLSLLGAEAKTAKVQIGALQREMSNINSKVQKTVAKRVQPQQAPKIDPKLSAKLRECTSNLRKDHAKLKMEARKRFAEIKPIITELAELLKTKYLSSVDQSQEIADLRQLYQREAMQRKIMYNKLQELRGNIRVFVRCRKDNRCACCFSFPSTEDIVPPGGRKAMKFDKIFTPDSTQTEVFEDTLPTITSCVDGYNVCILAYGQTNTGKTHTMQGQPQDPGVNVRSIQELLRLCCSRNTVDYTLKASMVEIYNETIQDLLAGDVKTLELRAQGKTILLPGQTEMPVEKIDDIITVMKLGEKNRKVAATKMNSQSSRSHLIFTITVMGTDKISGELSTGTLTLGDLAGSERVAKSEAQGQRLVEAVSINKSLSALAQVLKALRTNQLHVPFRNSKLTHLLQPSLSGDAKTCLFVTVSPDESHLSESLSSLEFGSNAKQVQLGQAKKNVKKKAPP